MLAYCTSCGAQRLPLVAKSTNLAGRPRIIGGAVARVLGWVTLAGGILLGLTLLGILQAIFPAGFAGYIVGLPIIAIASLFAIALLRGGRSLEGAGVAEQRQTREAAIFSLAENRGGIVTAPQVAASLGLSVTDADALLTAMAKERPDSVTLEVDDQGSIFYRVSARGLSRVQSFDEKLRVAAQPPAQPPLEEPAETTRDARARTAR